MQTKLNTIINRFQTEGTIQSVKPLGEGFINDTYIVVTVEDRSPNYILQRKNKNIFTNVPAMMDNILRVTTHLKNKIVKSGGDPMREALTLIPSKDGKLYYEDEEGEYWAVCVCIPDTLSYVSASSPALAYQGGKGIGKFQAMLSDFTEELTDILPGFHNMRFRFEQWDKALADDLAGRKGKLTKEIEWIESRRGEMLKLWSMVEDGTIPRRVTHNDTKISNILFDKDGDILCVIDLDTVLSSTVLNDYGDSMRSYTNTGEEDDPNLDNVSMNLEMFRAFTEGYLSETADFLTDSEKEYLAFSAKYITFEQVLRFLMDYINGDTYYRIKSPDHNLVRTHAQYKLLQSMEEQYPEMCRIVNETITKLK